MNKPQEKGPSLLGILLGGWMMVWIGVLAGILFMATHPIQGFSSQQELDRYLEKEDLPEIRPGEVYYIEGPDRSSVSWNNLRKQILDGASGEVELPAGAFNNWLSASFKIGRPDDDAVSGILLLPGLPKLSSLKTGEIFLSIPLEFTVYGSSYDRTYVAIGHIEAGDSPRFVLDKIQLDCAAIPVIS